MYQGTMGPRCCLLSVGLIAGHVICEIDSLCLLSATVGCIFPLHGDRPRRGSLHSVQHRHATTTTRTSWRAGRGSSSSYYVVTAAAAAVTSNSGHKAHAHVITPHATNNCQSTVSSYLLNNMPGALGWFILTYIFFFSMTKR